MTEIRILTPDDTGEFKLQNSFSPPKKSLNGYQIG